jgi:2-polyprenyl-3-methyl-5-hydroxy-6-metoxy-1,4-benzoquinol methylase
MVARGQKKEMTMTEKSTQLTENDIRPEHLMAEQAKRYQNDIDRLMRHKAEFMAVSCPACGGSGSEQAFEKYGMNFERCTACRTVYANPRPLGVHLNEYYSQSENYAYWNKYIFPASETVRRQKIFIPRVELVKELCTRHGISNKLLVEIGAGFGIFCEELSKCSFFERVVGVEPTPDLAATCRKRGTEIIEKPIEDIALEELLKGEKAIDVIAAFEVIEHLLDPREFLLKCASLLQTGGLVIVTCPNAEGFEIATLGAVSSSVDTEHLNLFNPHSLSLLFSQCGFEVVERATPGKLDADLVRNKVLSGDFDLSGQPFLKKVLMDEYERHGSAFQDFLRSEGLSSNMLIAARKI